MAPGGGRSPRHHDDYDPRDWHQGGSPARRGQSGDGRVPPTASGRGPGVRQPRPAPTNPEAYIPQFSAYGQRPEDQLRAQPRHAGPSHGQPAQDVGYGAEPFFDSPVPPTQRGARSPGRAAAPQQGRGHAGDPYADPRAGRGSSPTQARRPLRADADGYDQGYGQAAHAEPPYGQPQGHGRQGYGQYRQGGYDPGYEEPVAYEQPYPHQGYGDEPIDDQYEDEDEYEDDEPPRRGRRGLIVLGALVIAVALGGGLGYAYKLTGGDRAGVKPVVLKADTSPTKTQPEDPGGQAFDTAKKSIYERLGSEIDADGDGVPDAAGTDGEILPRQEEVLARASDGAEGAADPTLLQKPKKVNTITIKPGETITAEAATASDTGAEEGIPGISIAETMDEQPSVLPAKPKKKTQTVTASAAGTAELADMPASEEVAAGGASAEDGAEVVAAAEAEEVATTQTTKKKKKSASTEAQQLATATATPQPASGGGYVVQVRASKSRVDALGSFADLQAKHSDLLAATQPDIQQVDLGGTKGVWYRLRLGPPSSRKAAAELCSKLKAQGLKECIVAAY